MKYQLFRYKFLLAIVFVLACLSMYIGSKKSEKKLLIVGCARSGTLYISQVLKSAGLHIRHERMGRDGMCACDFTVLPKIGRWKVKADNYNFAHIFHQVRDPLNVISSTFVTEDVDSWHFIIKNMPQITMQDSHITRCAKYWYYWNLASENIAEWTYRVEDLNEHFDEFQERLKVDLSKDVLDSIPTNTHTYGTENRHQFTWEDLEKELEPELYFNICTLARKYGYEAP